MNGWWRGRFAERKFELVSSRRRFRPDPRSLRLAAVLTGMLAVSVGYVVLAAYWQSTSHRLTGFWDFVPSRAIDVLLVGWFFFVGSAIGSFLNVVAWRMPRGRSIRGRSHCPFCDVELGWRENWPVFGWIVLGGRCRHCRLPISPRYPIVETVVGLSVLTIAMSGAYRDATHLPYWPQRFGRVSALWMPKLNHDSLAVILYHVVAIGCVWALALVRFDSARLPRVLVGWCFALVALPMLVYPTFAVIPWGVTSPADWDASGEYLNAAMRVLTGLAIGVLLARVLASTLCPGADPKWKPLSEPTGQLIDLSMMLSLVGILIGWQATIPVTVVAVLLTAALPTRWLNRTEPLARWSVALPIAVTFQLACWKTLHEAAWWPSVGTAPVVTLAWAAGLMLFAGSLLKKPTDTNPVPVADPAESG